MIRINLLPFRAARKQENVKRQVTVFILAFILSVVALFGVHIWAGGVVGGLQDRKGDTELKLAKVQKQAEEVNAMKAHLAMVEKRLDVIKTLMADRAYPVKLLDHMTQWTVPDRMWLSSLESTKEKLVISGIAVDENTVSVFHKRLENSTQFTVVSLDRMDKASKFPGMTFQEFFLTCYKPVPVEEAKPDAAAPGAPGAPGAKPPEAGAKPAEAGKEGGK
ncbi:MAG: PilN domain-containing protein [Deltaproteobacteria bacterium]|nr:PilN domain-containing protein [Deltaproteobacteria bacterium]